MSASPPESPPSPPLSSPTSIQRDVHSHNESQRDGDRYSQPQRDVLSEQRGERKREREEPRVQREPREEEAEEEGEEEDVLLSFPPSSSSFSSPSTSSFSSSSDGKGEEGESPLERLNELLARTEQFAHCSRPPSASSHLSPSHPHPHRSSSRALSSASRSTSASSPSVQEEEEEEDARLMREEIEEEENGHQTSHLHQQPTSIQAVMRDYQLEALNWLIRLHDQSINGILADEMGLGKTLMSLSLLSYLKLHRQYCGPHLVIVPKSTSTNWVNEVYKWTNNLTVTKFHGTADEREIQKQTLGHCDITITTYEMCIKEKSALRKIAWRYVYIDEAHRIKNEKSLLSQVVRSFPSQHRLLITGTPLQNSLHELWALLNFLVPNIFDSSVDFESWFNLKGEDDKKAMIQRLHRILRPFLLRRLKSEVESTLLPKIETNLYVGLSAMQRAWYTKLLSRDMEVLNGQTAAQSKVRLLNIVMQLRKVANHPYLFTGAEPGPPYVEGEHLIENSGKMVLLDKLLCRLKADGHRVLIFSQMTRLLDILEDFCRYKSYEYCRIDGQTKQEERDDAMDIYNAPNSSKFLFLLSTRAGGLGINLQTADTVILYDSDWNPQMDLQAQDRAHRIGQKRQVRVFRFVTEGTIEEKIVERAMKKLFLDALVIKEGRLTDSEKALNAAELQDMVRFGANRIFHGSDSLISDEDIDTILAKGVAQTEKTQAKLKENIGAGFNLQTFSMSGENEKSTMEFEGVDYSGARQQAANRSFSFVSLPQRQRKENYNESAYFREALRIGPVHPRGQKREYRPTLRPDFQLFDNERLIALEKKEYDSEMKYRELKAKKQEEAKEKKRIALEREKEEKMEERRRRKRELAAKQALINGRTLSETDNVEEAMSEEDDSIPQDISTNISSVGSASENANSVSSLSVMGENEELDGSMLQERSSRSKTTKKVTAMTANNSIANDQVEDEDEVLWREVGRLTDAEEKEKKKLLSAGFGDWMRRHFDAYVKACEKYGRDNIKQISESAIDGRSSAEIKAYHLAFWKEGRGKLMKDYDKLISRLDRSDSRRERVNALQALIDAKVKRHKKPWDTLMFPYQGLQKSWTLDEDRGLFLAVNECGYGEWDEVKAVLRASWMFRFDWFLKTRTSAELQKRMDLLIKLIEKENADLESAKQARRQKNAATQSSKAATVSKSKRKSTTFAGASKKGVQKKPRKS